MIGFIGVGVMGEPMCRNLASKSGEAVLAFDIVREPLERLQSHGVAAAASVREIAERCHVVLLSLPGAAEVSEVCIGRASLLMFMHPATHVIDLSTTPVALARDLHARFAARGIHFVDAPVARTRAAAQAGTLSAMVGCSEDEFARVKPLLAHIATDVTRCGGPGSGQAMKLANNMVLFQNVVAIAEALALVRCAGIDAQLALEVLAKGSADSFALRHHGMQAILADNFPERAYSVQYALKDLGYALELAQAARLELRGALNAKALLDEAAAAGFATQYFPVIAKVI